MPPDNPKRVWLVDSTLRDGEQAPGVVFSAKEKIRLASHLARIGIPEIEAGSPAAGAAERECLMEIAAMRLPCRVTGWCRAREQDLDDARKCGLGAVHISIPVSPVQLAALGKTQAWIEHEAAGLVRHAARRFSFISVGFQDASRSDPAVLAELAVLMCESGADRIRLADTVGIWNPMQVFQVFQMMRARLPEAMLGFHAHNDLGMATANTLTAISAGADSADVTLNGLGERAGNAALEEVVVGLKISLGLDSGVKTERLAALCRLAAFVAGRPLSVSKPVSGRDIFRHESGIHCDALIKDRRTYEPYPPEMVGRARHRFVIGKHSGASSLTQILHEEGISISRDEARDLLPSIRALSQNLKRALKRNELITLAKSG